MSDPAQARRRKPRPNIRTGLGIAAAIVLGMVLSLGWMLGRQIRDLESAGVDNTQWTLAQLELETAIFAREVIAQARDVHENMAQLRLRFEIVASRLNLLRGGEIGRSLRAYPEVPLLLDRIDAYVDRIDTIFAGEIDEGDLMAIFEATRAVQPVMRELSLNGLDILADDAEAYRHRVRRQAELTALAGGLLLILLGALLRLIDVQRRRVLERDRVLSRTADRLHSVIHASLDAIVLADRKGIITDFNPAAEEMFGWRKNEILGAALSDTLMPVSLRERYQDGLESFFESGRRQPVGAGRIELLARRRNDEEFPVEVALTTTEGHSGPMLIGYLRDITDLKASRAKLIAARDAAERADRAKSRFLSVMSHEMRTPLNGIMGVLDLLGTSRLDAEQRQQVGVALASAEILLQLVNESLDITRIETGEETIETAPFAPVPMLQRLVSVLRPLAAEKDLPLELSFEEAKAGLWYEGDPNRIAQVITNLIGNAIKFTEQGTITVRFDSSAEGIEIVVRDTGIGIAPGDLEKVFAEFVTRARPEGRQGRSDGLGLAISRRLARMMSGDITVTSAPGEGSSFRLVLPLRQVPAPLEAPPPPEGSTPHGTALSVLVVEDNAVNRLVLRGMLRQFGHEVSEARNGVEGVEMMREGVFDLVLMDFEMPMMGGIEAARQIRDALPPEARPPVIGLTAHGSAEARQAGIEAGMSGVHAKPLRLPTLRRILEALIERRLAEDAAPQVSCDEEIEAEVFEEMVEMLGAEQVGRALDRFESDWARARSALKDAAGGEVTAIVHKLRGGAAMLGLESLGDALGEIELAAPDRLDPARIEMLDRAVARGIEAARDRINLGVGG